MNVFVGIAIAVVFAALAITLGVKFFNTSVKDEEREKGWE